MVLLEQEMKKIYLIVPHFIQLCCYVGAWLIQHFTAKKMGMLRWVNSISNKWSKNTDVEMLFSLFAVFMAVGLLLLLFWVLGKVQRRSAAFELLMVSTVLTAGAYTAFVAGGSRKLIASFYLVSPLLALAAFVTIIVLFLAALREK